MWPQHITFLKASSVDGNAGNMYTIFEICIQYLQQSKTAVCSWTSFLRNKGISKVVFKSMQCFL